MAALYLIIDIGSNSCKGSLFRRTDGGDEEISFPGHRHCTRLGADVGEDGRLPESAVERCLRDTASILLSAREFCAGIGERISGIYCFGTAAARNAANREELVSRFCAATGHELHILSSGEEAFFERRGVLSSETARRHQGKALLLADFGGSSTELSYVPEGWSEADCRSMSFEYGQNVYRSDRVRWAKFRGELEPFFAGFSGHIPAAVILAGSAVASYVVSSGQLGEGSQTGRHAPEGAPVVAGGLVTDGPALAGAAFVELIHGLCPVPAYLTTFGARHGVVRTVF